MLAIVWLGDLVLADDSSGQSAATLDRTTLDPSWLSDVRHPITGLLSRGVRPEEGVGYFAILNHTRELSPTELKEAAKRFEQGRFAAVKNDPNYHFYFRKGRAEFPTFVDLFRDPERYHGQPVTFHGHVRRIISFAAGKNAHGFQQLHEVWLYAEESQQNPVVVICSELPAKIPTGSDLLVDFVSVTGYFFKRYGYEDRSGQTRFAPLILAHQPEWHPPMIRNRWLSKTTIFAIPFGVAALIATVCWKNARQDRLAIRLLSTTDESDNDTSQFQSNSRPT
ncbi:MAG: hypothetical protein NT013_01235 [Planctomycetia bacterium]|nr:hypothetical protein [Planctomycetia bacterium]